MQVDLYSNAANEYTTQATRGRLPEAAPVPTQRHTFNRPGVHLYIFYIGFVAAIVDATI